MNTILIRYGEIFLKGNNRNFFENTLVKNINNALNCYKYELKKISGRYEISSFDAIYEVQIISKLTKIFGIHSICLATKVETDVEKIEQVCAAIKIIDKSFRVTVRRASKIFPIKSIEFSSRIGSIVLEKNPSSKVDLHNPDTEIKIDIRENGYTYISTEDIAGANGMPIGTAGKGILLLSGGIDSPVAGYFLAKRGLEIEALHFNSYPYTSELAKQKVISLAKKMKDYLGNINLNFISLTHIQEEINKKCDNDLMITILRRMMIRISCAIAHKKGCGCLITGESLGQVASQTLQSINATNSVSDLPVFRPLIGFDKEDITLVARKIGTYEISILPYEDCCTVFLPKNPATKPKKDKVEKEESKLDIDNLINEALSTLETIII